MQCLSRSSEPPQKWLIYDFIADECQKWEAGGLQCKKLSSLNTYPHAQCRGQRGGTLPFSVV